MKVYVFRDKADAVRCYKALQRAAGLPRKSQNVVQHGRGPHAKLAARFDPAADRNVGWDESETGPVMVDSDTGEYIVRSTQAAQVHEGKQIRLDTDNVDLPKSGDRKERSAGIDSKWARVRERRVSRKRFTPWQDVES